MVRANIKEHDAPIRHPIREKKNPLTAPKSTLPKRIITEAGIKHDTDAAVASMKNGTFHNPKESA